MKFHPSIVALGRAIYAMRFSKKGFDRTAALVVLGHDGLSACVEELDEKMRAVRPGAGVVFRQDIFGQMLEVGRHEASCAVLDAYRRATAHFPPFTDLFGLAAEWLYANRGVDIRDRFAGPALFQRAVDVAVGKFGRGEFDPDLAMVVNGSRIGSSALGLIYAFRATNGEAKLADSDFVLLCTDELDMLLATTQISAWLMEMPCAIRSVAFTFPSDLGQHVVLRIGEDTRCVCRVSPCQAEGGIAASEHDE